MARPSLTNESFLAHVFSPKKNAQPTGLRKTTLAPTKGRKVARVNAFNKMTSVKQEVLKRSGQRDAYLRGEINFTQAKQALRNTAVKLRVVKPLKRKYGTGKYATPSNELLRRIADNIWQKTKERPHARRHAIDENVFNLLKDPKVDMVTWEYQTITNAAKGEAVNGVVYKTFDTTTGKTVNPFFYH